MAGFQHDIAGGQGDLIVAQLQSPNFSIADETGWAILKNGDAYFFNVTAEGSITTSSVIIEGSTGNILVYSGTPATGNLVGSWAGANGEDGESNSYSAGLTIGTSGNPQLYLKPATTSGTASELQFPLTTPALSNIANIGAGPIDAGAGAELVVSGPAITTTGSKDWVQLALFSNTGGGTANMQFVYVDTSGGAHLTATMNDGGWTFSYPVTISDGITVNYMTSPNGNPVFGWSQDGSYPLSTSVPDDPNSGETWADGERAFMNGNWVAAINANAGLTNFIYSVLQDAGIIAGG